jgi:hypothetical protein
MFSLLVRLRLPLTINLPKAIVERIVASSATFSSKTVFSQSKYLKKKRRQYVSRSLSSSAPVTNPVPARLASLKPLTAPALLTGTCSNSSFIVRHYDF